jgi:chromate transporter
MPAPIALLLTLAWHCAVLSLFAVGGGVSILIPQMHQEFVLQYHWIDERSFAELLAVAQASPGPNSLLVPLLGWKIASWPGLVITLVSFSTLPVLIAFVVGRVLHQRDNEWVARIRRAFQPVTAGLWMASGIAVASATDHGLVPLLLTAGVALLALAFDISPLWWCLGAGVLGAIFV